jgi:hypothetical protein
MLNLNGSKVGDEDAAEECAAQDEQSLDYFNHYIAGDR